MTGSPSANSRNAPPRPTAQQMPQQQPLSTAQRYNQGTPPIEIVRLEAVRLAIASFQDTHAPDGTDNLLTDQTLIARATAIESYLNGK